MLEKIGLPAKPSLRGNNWVVDASHCQGCSSQFTFINRKHHCRRCGGLFCSSCTQHRMVLRGQGDSPVRICDPCKQLEEAARFEMRHGQRNRAGRGGLRPTSKDEDEVLSQILGEDRKHSFSSAQGSATGAVYGINRAASSASCSNKQEVVNQDGGEILRSLSVDEPNNLLGDLNSASPQELREQALEEKKKHKILKGEGKLEEALRAFKRGKELERQAAALELLLRKSRKKATNKLEMHKTTHVPSEYGIKDKCSLQLGKEKDDVATELRDLGWSDADIHEADKKPVSMSLEGELSTLIGDFSEHKTANNGSHRIDKTEVVALKRKALMLKREGKLAEAKEELKRAKILEKQLEEQEFFVESEDSDDEIASLIRSMDSGKPNEHSVVYDAKPDLDFSQLVGVDGDFSVETFDVTDEDMNDPEIAAALDSLGWADESTPLDEVAPQIAVIDSEAVNNEIQSLKREAVNQKRAGNSPEAVRLLKKAKELERDPGSYAFNGHSSTVEDPQLLRSSVSRPVERSPWPDLVDDLNSKINNLGSNPAPKSKLMIQKELLSLKKKALALRREGRVDEADEELKKGQVLEQQLEEMTHASSVKVMPANFHNNSRSEFSSSVDVINDREGDVTDQDMLDPTYLADLNNLGWKDDNEVENVPLDIPTQTMIGSAVQAPSSTQNRKRKSKAEIQSELLGLKRKALGLRRQGDTEGAEDILKIAKVLEDEMAEIEEPNREMIVECVKEEENISSIVMRVADKGAVSERDSRDNTLLPVQRNLDKKVEVVESTEGSPDQGFISQDSESSLQQEILVHKRKAISLKREGKLADAREELRQAKLLEKSLEQSISHCNSTSIAASVSASNVASSRQKEHSSPNAASRPLSGRDRFKLQQESLGHKRQALKLRREGRIQEAESEFEIAKSLEAQLEESNSLDLTGPSANREPEDDVGVEDFLDPQLFSSLKALGLDDVNLGPNGPGKSEPVKVNTRKSEASSLQKVKLEERIKAEKVKAVSLKRSGKQTEASDALRQVKLLEKKLNSIDS